MAFKIGSETVRGTLFEPEGNGPFPAVIFYHGRGSSRNRYLPIAKRLAEKGICALAFDFRGCGKSDGIFEEQTNENGIEDAASSLAFLLKQNVDKARIGICGTSFGGYVAVMILPKQPFVKSVLLRAPASYAKKILKAPTSEESEKGFFKKRDNWEDSAAYERIQSYRGSLLVVKCERDGWLEDEMVERYYNEAIKTKQRKLKVLEGADHALTNQAMLERFYDLIEEWFIKTL